MYTTNAFAAGPVPRTQTPLGGGSLQHFPVPSWSIGATWGMGVEMENGSEKGRVERGEDGKGWKKTSPKLKFLVTSLTAGR